MTRRLVFLGAPGAGKGTYASRLSARWRIPHISTGDMIRHEIAKDSTLGRRFQQFSDQGKLVPDDLVIEIAKDRLAEPDVSKGFILDGFPRTVEQAVALSTISSPDLCINVRLPDKYLVMKLAGRRVCRTCGRNYNVADIRDGEYDMPPLEPKEDDCEKCHGKPDLYQRQDDKEEVVKARLDTYKRETEPLIQFYGDVGILVNFDVKKGVRDLPDITALIDSHLNAPE